MPTQAKATLPSLPTPDEKDPGCSVCASHATSNGDDGLITLDGNLAGDPAGAPTAGASDEVPAPSGRRPTSGGTAR